ncbi:MAG TPA: hypothetical protein VGR35_00540 [Tepidisphaeraceae bacterium]|nr:hypothetical protein [Tepidisphaeraceae bacterium]
MNEKRIIILSAVGMLTLVVTGGIVAMKLARPKTEAVAPAASLPSSSAPPATVPVKSSPALASAREPSQAAAQPVAEQRAELDRLRKENERLRREVTAMRDVQAKQTVAPAPAPTTSTPISGSAWLTRANASSDMLRGLRVYLLPSAIPRKLLVPRLVQERDKFLKSAAEHQERAKLPYAGDYAKKDAQRDSDAARKIDETVAKLQDQVDTKDAHALLKTLSRFNLPYLSFAAESVALASTRTGPDGKYAFTKLPQPLPPGTYYLFAEVDSSAMFVDWLIPITVGSDGQASAAETDLFNDNAATLHNSR